MLKYRLILGPALIIALVLILWADETLAGRPTTFLNLEAWPRGSVLFVVMLPITFMAARELARILRERKIAAATGVTCVSAFAGLLVSCLVPRDIHADLAVAIVATTAIAILLLSLAYYSNKRSKHADAALEADLANPDSNWSAKGGIASAGGSLLAFVYLGLMFGFVLAIRRDHSAWVLLWVLMVTKMSDTGAYFTGRSFGKRAHKLILWLSPGKTWEGLFGGIAFAALVGAVGLMILKSQLPAEKLPEIWAGAVAGALAAVFGQAGDLVMSLFKRDAGRKDSGHSIPGFGGVLDILDSPLLVTPLAYWWLRLAA